MNRIFIKARAKINLALDIVGRRPDGYHELRTVMQTLALYDGVYIQKIEKPAVKLVCDMPRLPVDDRNLATKAAKHMMDRYALPGGVFIRLNKAIFVSAGLAGGSSDCAAVLAGMRKIYDLPIEDEALREIGLAFGADVPYCLMGGTALAEGVGERLTPLPPHPPVFVLLAKPKIRVSTQMIFDKYNESQELCRGSDEFINNKPDIDAMVQHINDRELTLIARGFCNVLEPVTAAMHPIVGELKSMMIRSGAMNAAMSGSGPTVFGLFEDKKQAESVCNHLKGHYNNSYLTEIAHQQV